MIVDASGFIKAIKLRKVEKLHEPKTTKLIFYELGNVLWKESRIFKRFSSAEAQAMLKDWILWIECNFDIYEPDWHATLAIALETGLSYYDASYLWLAKKVNEPIVTADKDLKKHWKAIDFKKL